MLQFQKEFQHNEFTMPLTKDKIKEQGLHDGLRHSICLRSSCPLGKLNLILTRVHQEEMGKAPRNTPTNNFPEFKKLQLCSSSENHVY
jgi:glutamate synthase (NADPH/NADH) small chain